MDPNTIAITSDDDYDLYTTFTGNRDTDRLVLLNLPYDAVPALCSSSRYLRDLCDNEAGFWIQKYKRDFGKWTYAPGEVNPKDQYIYTVNLLKRQPTLTDRLNVAITNRYDDLALNLLDANRAASNTPFTKEEVGEFLVRAADSGAMWMVEKLINKLPLIPSIYVNAATPVAQRQRHTDIVNLLQSAGYAPRGSQPDTALLITEIAKENMAFVDLLVKNGVREQYVSVVSIAVTRNNYDLVKLLLDAGFGTDPGALRLASSKGYVNIMKLLLDRSTEDINGALRGAVRAGQYEAVQLLLKYGADVRTIEESDLRFAAVTGHRDVVDLINAHYV